MRVPNEEAHKTAADVARHLGAEKPIQEKIRREGAEKTVEDWMEQTKANPQMVALMNVVQDFADVFEDRQARGQPMRPDEMKQVVQRLAQKYNVPPQRAIQTVQAVMDRYNLASKRAELEEHMADAPKMKEPVEPQQNTEGQEKPGQQRES